MEIKDNGFMQRELTVHDSSTGTTDKYVQFVNTDVGASGNPALGAYASGLGYANETFVKQHNYGNGLATKLTIASITAAATPAIAGGYSEEKFAYDAKLEMGWAKLSLTDPTLSVHHEVLQVDYATATPVAGVSVGTVSFSDIADILYETLDPVTAHSLKFTQGVDLGSGAYQQFGYVYKSGSTYNPFAHSASAINPLLPGGTNSGDISWAAGDAVSGVYLSQSTVGFGSGGGEFAYSKFKNNTTGQSTQLAKTNTAIPVWPPLVSSYIAQPGFNDPMAGVTTAPTATQVTTTVQGVAGGAAYNATYPIYVVSWVTAAGTNNHKLQLDKWLPGATTPITTYSATAYTSSPSQAAIQSWLASAAVLGASYNAAQSYLTFKNTTTGVNATYNTLSYTVAIPNYNLNFDVASPFDAPVFTTASTYQAPPALAAMSPTTATYAPLVTNPDSGMALDAWTVSAGSISTTCPVGATCSTVVADNGFKQLVINKGGKTYYQTIITDAGATGTPTASAFAASSLAFSDESFVQTGADGLINKLLFQEMTIIPPAVGTVQMDEKVAYNTTINAGWADGGITRPKIFIDTQIATHDTNFNSTSSYDRFTYKAASNGSEDMTIFGAAGTFLTATGFQNPIMIQSRKISGDFQTTTNTGVVLPTPGLSLAWSPSDTIQATWVGGKYATAAVVTGSVYQIIDTTSYTNLTTGQRVAYSLVNPWDPTGAFLPNPDSWVAPFGPPPPVWTATPSYLP